MSDGTALPDSRLTVHVLRITLLDVTPKVWRTVRVPSSVTLGLLHVIVQIAMGWEDVHLHEWQAGDITYGPPDEEDWGEAMADEGAVTLGQAAGPDEVLRYDYDLGDGWEHLLEVLEVAPFDATQPPVEVIDGAGACPPEDSGGPGGYEHFLDALADPDDEEHEDLVEWRDAGFDPAQFDRDAVNVALEGLWRP